MTMLRIILVFIFSTLLLAGCDPGKVLIIKASNKNNTSVTIYTNRKLIPFDTMNDESKMIIHVPSNDTTTRRLYYGMGGWSNDAVNYLITNIDSIIIINTADRLVLKDKTGIESYLKKHRHGYGKSVLKIKAK